MQFNISNLITFEMFCIATLFRNLEPSLSLKYILTHSEVLKGSLLIGKTIQKRLRKFESIRKKQTWKASFFACLVAIFYD